MRSRDRLGFARLALGIALALLLARGASAANLILINIDPPGEGLNDPTPAAPVGGNSGTTIGEQRVNVYNRALEIWGTLIESDQDIFVAATFIELPCTPTGAVLGAAGTNFVLNNFPGAKYANTWYSQGLSEALSGENLIPDEVEIVSFFNSLIEGDPTCLGGRRWYYGFDNDEGDGIDFLSVVLHEVGHGLGFQNFVTEATGELLAGLPDIYTRFTLDLTKKKFWHTMTQAERQASAINVGNVVWFGPKVMKAAPSLLGPRPSLIVTSPSTIDGSYEAQPASFGPPLSGGPTSGAIVVANDGTDAPGDGCEAIINDVSGKIALVDRGSCTFATKVANAQAAGAIGAIVANNAPKGLPGMGGSDPTITIPSVGVTFTTGALLKGAASPTGTLTLDPAFQAGTQKGFVRLYAPDPVEPGSSGSHFDVTAFPNLLMEPAINADLESATTLDLTPSLLYDIGWKPGPP